MSRFRQSDEFGQVLSRCMADTDAARRDYPGRRQNPELSDECILARPWKA